MFLSGKRWSLEESEILETWWGIKSAKSIAKMVGRTETAVASRANYLGLGKAYDSGLYLMIGHVCEILGYNYGMVANWIKYNGFPARKKKLLKSRRYFIDKEKMVKWLKDNQELWSSDRLDYLALGVEAEEGWLKEKRKSDMHKRRRGALFTQREIDILIRERNKGTKYREIGSMLGRNRESIKNKTKDLIKKGVIKKLR